MHGLRHETGGRRRLDIHIDSIRRNQSRSLHISRRSLEKGATLKEYIHSDLNFIKTKIILTKIIKNCTYGV